MKPQVKNIKIIVLNNGTRMIGDVKPFTDKDNVVSAISVNRPLELVFNYTRTTFGLVEYIPMTLLDPSQTEVLLRLTDIQGIFIPSVFSIQLYERFLAEFDAIGEDDIKSLEDMTVTKTEDDRNQEGLVVSPKKRSKKTSPASPTGDYVGDVEKLTNDLVKEPHRIVPADPSVKKWKN